MTTSLLLSVLTCFIFTSLALFVWLSVLKDKNKDKEGFLFAWTWFFLAGVVGFMGVRTLLFGFGFIILDLGFALIDQVFLLIGLIFLVYYICFKFFKIFNKEKWTEKFVFAFFLPLILVSQFFLFNYVIQEFAGKPKWSLQLLRQEIVKQRVVSSWGSEFIPPANAMFFTKLVFLFIFILAIHSLILFFVRWKINKNKKAREDFLLILSLLIFLIALIFDQSGLNAGWYLLLFRSTIIVSPMIAYIAWSNRKYFNNYK